MRRSTEQKEDIFKFGANVKKIYNTAAYNNLDIYQVNCSYYSALGDDDASYLLARAVQFFSHREFRRCIMWDCWQAGMT